MSTERLIICTEKSKITRQKINNVWIQIKVEYIVVNNF